VPRRPQAARLLAVSRDESNTRLRLLGSSETSIGSDSGAGLKVAGPGVSTRHATIRYRRGNYYLTSFKSPGGTFINDMKVVRARRLQHGDTVRFGEVAYRFIDPDAASRQRGRRIFRVATVVGVIALAVIAHARQWDDLLSSSAVRVMPKGWQPPPADTARSAVKMTSTNRQPPVTGGAPAMPPITAKIAGAIVAASSTPAGTAPQVTWIQRINFFRTMAGVSAIRESAGLSAGVQAHARYLMTNYAGELRSKGWIGDAAYKEDRSRKGYSKDGAAAAANSQVAWGCGEWNSARQIDRWIGGPFHRLDILSPSLKEAGFGEFAQDGCWVAALRLPEEPEGPQMYAAPVEFPPGGSTVSIGFIGGEMPDPLATCPEYQAPVGLPITLEIGRLIDVKLGRATLMQDGQPVEHCTFDAESYHSPNSSSQEYGRWALRSHGAVVMIPRAPLKPGPHYSVSISANDHTYSWSFQIADRQQ
jgi:uncharacterized protein YkwD